MKNLNLKTFLNFKKESEIFKYFFKYDLINNYRIKIDTGFTCNAKCFFCYYKNHLNDPFMDKNKILFQIGTAKKLNFKKMEFSGGESSFHPDWFNFLNYAKNLNLEISTLSNGFKFSDINFLKKSKNYGLNEILFSLHSFKKNHDKHLGINGAFDKIIKAILNSLELNTRVRINITITHSNQNYLLDLFEYLEQQNILPNIYQFNFLPINEWGDAKIVGQKNQNKLNLNLLYPIFDKIINSKKLLNIRYYPYCFIDKKYHEYLKNHIHHFIDIYDWHPFFIYYANFLDKEKIKAFKFKKLSKYLNFLYQQRQTQYFYEDKCKNCLYKNICDGFKRI